MTGVFLALAAVLLWSTVPVGTRLLVRSDGAFSVAFLSAVRLWIAAIIFAGIRFITIRRTGQPFRFHIRKKKWLFAAAAGLCLNYIFYGIGLRFTTAGATSVVSQVQPIVTVLLAALLLGESLTWRKISGMLIAIAGVILVIFHGTPLQALFTSQHFLGNMIEVLAAVVWPLYAIGQTKLLRESEDRQVLEPIFVLAAIMTTLFLPFTGKLILHPPTTADWLMLIFLGVGSTAAAYWFFALATQKLETSVTAMFNVTMPLFALFLAYFLLGEPLHPQVLSGLVLVIGGLLLIVWRRHHEEMPQQRRCEIQRRQQQQHRQQHA